MKKIILIIIIITIVIVLIQNFVDNSESNIVGNPDFSPSFDYVNNENFQENLNDTFIKLGYDLSVSKSGENYLIEDIAEIIYFEGFIRVNFKNVSEDEIKIIEALILTIDKDLDIIEFQTYFNEEFTPNINSENWSTSYIQFGLMMHRFSIDDGIYIYCIEDPKMGY